MLSCLRSAVLPLLAGVAGLAQAAPLSFTAALDLAERQSPALAADTAQVNAARSAAGAAGAWPDPKLFAGIENLPVSGTEAWQLQADGMTMQKIGVAQDVPNADKRHAREAVAAARIDVADARRQVARRAVRRDAALAWLDLFYLRRKERLLDALDRENALLARTVAAQLAAGRGPVADAVAPQQEAAQLADRRDDLARDIAQARSRLRQQVGPQADDGLAGDPPQWTVDAQQLRERLHQHPDWLTFAAETRQAEAEVREAQAMKKSDWGVELAYQRRAPQYGNMVSIQFTFELPVSPATRQDPLIAARQQDLRRIDAEREGLLREHASELDSRLAEYAALTRQRDRAEHTVLPLIEQKLALQTASYQAGKGDLNAVLAARRERIDQDLRIVDLQAQQATAAARLHFADSGDAP